MALRTPIVAIVGRPNVGKSTLFNRIIGEDLAVVEDVEGVTRDRNSALSEIYSIPFYAVDTGGFEKESEDKLAQMVSEQAVLAIEEADVIIAMFDGNAGLQQGDRDVVTLLRKGAERDRSKVVLYVVNKCDGKEQAGKVADFYELGVNEIFDLSARHGQGVNIMIETALQSLADYEAHLQSWNAKQDALEEEFATARHEFEQYVTPEMLDEELSEDSEEERIVEWVDEEDFSFPPVYVPGKFEGSFGKQLSPAQYDNQYKLRPILQVKHSGVLFEDEEIREGDSLEDCEVMLPEIEQIRVAIIGRPNVGKSTLFNTLTGEQRAITSEIAGTTRDSLDSSIRRDGQEFLIVDTAGLRKKARISDRVEQYSTLRALRAIRESDVAVLLLDATSGPTVQDTKVAGLAHDEGRGLVIVVNKWDLVEKNHKTVKEFTENIREAFRFAAYAPIIFVSALKGKRCPKIIEEVRKVAVERRKRISTASLNKALKRAVEKNSLPVYRGRPLKLYFGSQVGVAPPRFVLFFNHPKGVHFSYQRYLKNCLRESYSFDGSDIKLVLRKR